MKDIIQLSIEGLLSFIFSHDDMTNGTHVYANVLLCYLKEDIESLENILDGMNASSFSPLLEQLIIIRMALLKNEISKVKLNKFESFVKFNNDDQVLVGEAYFLLGYSFCNLKNYECSKRCYLLAYNIFLNEKIDRKALKSLFNYVVSESRLNNDKKLIVDYKYIANKARAIGDSIVEGLCYLNISQEYANANILELALRTCNQAVALLNLDHGVNHYYFALLQRCEILIKLNRYEEALSDYQIIQYSDIKEIKMALKVIDKSMGDKKVNLEIKRLGPTWYSKLKRLNDNKEESQLTKKESEVIEYLSEKPLAAVDLAILLYGEDINFESAMNRMKVLLSRLRKKNNDLIIHINGLYSIRDETSLVHLIFRGKKKRIILI